MASDRLRRVARICTIAFSLGFIGLCGVLWSSQRGAVASVAAPRATLIAFKSDTELKAFLKKHQRPPPMADAEMAPPPPPAPAQAQAGMASTVTAAKSSDGITNNQEASVDEGDIVKAHGDTLVILRRGRLFTVSLAHGGMRPVDHINAYPPGVDARDDWYDEMLMTGDRIVVIGYSYARGGTEINRFHIDGDGHLSFIDAYQLRSGDYYSSRNYASRLIGHNLIFYSPLWLPYGTDDLLETLPAMRQWSSEDPMRGFTRIVGAQHVYIPASLRDSSALEIDAMHTVTTCDLTKPVLSCEAMSVLGPNSRTFYVSGNAVYVWVTGWHASSERDTLPASLVYRLPLDGSAPQAIGARGAPEDQFSFREDPSHGVLDVLVRSQGYGDAMWRPEFSEGSVALLEIPLAGFGDGSREVGRQHYRMLPSPTAQYYAFHNRFIGDYVLYGTGTSWGGPVNGRSTLVAASTTHDAVSSLELPYTIDRIEAMGGNGVVIGADSQNLNFTAVELTGRREPKLGDRYIQPGTSQSETRSHGFFFRPDDASDDSPGVLGLPIARPAREGYRQLFENSAGMTFLRRTDRRFIPLGELDATSEGITDDACVASCVDWYGNARPIFLNGRTFALLGYELVEGTLGDMAIKEVGRVSFAPTTRSSQRSPS